MLERFLSRVLDVRETEERRQTAIKVLLALTDLDRNVRAGVLTVESLQQKLAGSVADSEIMETVQWPARGDVRLITPSKLRENLGYELAHERLIPALRKLAGKELSQADQANQLLNRRANEWLGNERDKHYLLRWRELRKINKQKNFLVWGESEKTRKELIAQSRSRQRKQFIALSGLLILFLIFLMLRPTINSKIIEPRQRNQRFEELRDQFVFVEGDTFKMGDSRGYSEKDERPVHEVALSNFKISKYEITNQQYCDFLNSLATASVKVTDRLVDISGEYCHIKRREEGKFMIRGGFESHPVATVSWYGAVVFCNFLSQHFGHRPCYNLRDWSCDSTANGYRLPAEAEWEFAAQGGIKSKGYEYSGNDSLNLVAWCDINTRGGPQPVGTKKPNELGLYDMTGNAWEWCNDWYDAEFYEKCHQQGIAKNPLGPQRGNDRVVRGGSWSDFVVFGVRCVNRFKHRPDQRGYDFGFRVVRSAQS